MARHVVVDGSNIATEGRTKPSLKQLNEAVMAFMAENPKDTITVIVDATFGHRIDRKEVAEFDEAIANNELVAPPAGTVGRGDAFVLMIAQKVGASILSNDSYQEFHGQYAWLFHEGRLIGGKPVPHVGWVFVNRTPVRGEKSRRASAGKALPKVSHEAMKPMPVPKAPPPGASLGKKKQAKAQSAGASANTRTKAKDTETREQSTKNSTKPAPTRAATPKTVNDVLPFLQFLEHNPIGSTVTGVVESYSSHGAYVQIGDVLGYVPLRLMGDPPPRAARDAMSLGEQVSLEVVSVVASRRSIDLKPSTSKSTASKSTSTKTAATNVGAAKEPGKKVAAPKKAAAKKDAVKKAPAKKVAAPKKAVAPKKAAAKKVAAKKAPAKNVSAPKKAVAPKKAAAKKVAAKKAPVKKVTVPKKSARSSATKK